MSCYSQAKNLREESGKCDERTLLSRLEDDRKETGQQAEVQVASRLTIEWNWLETGREELQWKKGRSWEKQMPLGRCGIPQEKRENQTELKKRSGSKE